MNDLDDEHPVDPDKIASVRRWLQAETDKLALSNSDYGFLHSSQIPTNDSSDPFWEYDSDYSDLDDTGPF